MTFKCTHADCGRTFKSSENLRRHVRSHSQVQPFRCTTCGKHFSRSDLCRRHEATHKGKTLPQKSSLGKRTSRSSPLSDHDRSTDESGLLAQDRQIFSEVQDNVLSHLNERDEPCIATDIGAQSDLSGHAPVRDIQLPAENGQLDFLDDWFNDEFFSTLAEANLFDFDRDSDPMANSQMDASFPFHLTLPDDVGGHDTAGINGPDPVSRSSSPLQNEFTISNRVPAIQDTRSSDVLTAIPVTIPEDHPLFGKYKPRLTLSTECYQRLHIFLQLSITHGLRHHPIQMPHLKTANLFVELFFARYAVHNPVIHLATLDSLDHLPDALLVAMIAIGATYSEVKHCRRFAIVLQDLARVSLYAALELDHRMLRDPLTSYAAVLICYAGLWSGNQQAMEHCEVLRATIVSCYRRYSFAKNSDQRLTQDSSIKANLSSVWKNWVKHETKKRVLWSIYGLDCESCILINLSPLMTLTEVALMDCPCDQEFWIAPSTRKWKQLLGLASLPPSKRFSYILSPFIELDPEPSTVSLNAWSQRLVVMALSVEVYQFWQRRLFHGVIDYDFDSDEELECNSFNVQNDYSAIDRDGTSTKRCPECTLLTSNGLPTAGLGLHQKLLDEKSRAHSSLMLFSSTLPPLATSPNTIVDRNFLRSTTLLVQLAHLVLDVGIANLRDALSIKDKEDQAAMQYFRHWSNCPNGKAYQTGLLAVEILNLVVIEVPKSVTGETVDFDIAPTQFVAVFLAAVTVWVFLATANARNRIQFQQRVFNGTVLDRELHEVLKAAILAREGTDQGSHPSKASLASFTTILFRYTADVLTRMRPWGAPLGLALLLHRRAKMWGTI